MRMKGERLIPASRDAVWSALNDLRVLQASIPGCNAIATTADNSIETVIIAKAGPVKAPFRSLITLSDLDPPNSYTLRAQAKGGIAGFADIEARVRLTDAEGGTLLVYEVDAAVGGKLAQIGARLIDSTARRVAEEFFAAFGALAGGGSDQSVSEASAAGHRGESAAAGAMPNVSPTQATGLGLRAWRAVVQFVRKVFRRDA